MALNICPYKMIRSTAASLRRLLRHKKQCVRLLRLKKRTIREVLALSRRLLRHKKRSMEAIELSPSHVRLSNTAQKYLRLLRTWLQEAENEEHFAEH